MHKCSFEHVSGLTGSTSGNYFQTFYETPNMGIKYKNFHKSMYLFGTPCFLFNYHYHIYYILRYAILLFPKPFTTLQRSRCLISIDYTTFQKSINYLSINSSGFFRTNTRNHIPQPPYNFPKSHFLIYVFLFECL